MFLNDDPEEHLRRERAKARELRRSRWWQNRVARGSCHYCGRSFPPRELTLDHVVPLVRGGRSSKGNCVPACKECNSRKQSLLPVEWEEYLERVQRDGSGAPAKGQSSSNSSSSSSGSSSS